jgi:hypothetical protein
VSQRVTERVNDGFLHEEIAARGAKEAVKKGVRKSQVETVCD